jgi:hypothetical protein
MIEERVAESMREAVADEPPLGFDPDEVLTEAADRRRRRWAAGATGLAVGGMTLAAVAVFGVGGTAGPHQVSVGAGPSGSNVPTATSTVPPFAGSDSVVANLGPVIPTVLNDRVPGLVFDKPLAGELMVDERRRGVLGSYRAAGSNVHVSIYVYHDENALDLAGDPVAGVGPVELVSDTPQQDGSHLRVYAFDDGSALDVSVVHLRTDGVIVVANSPSELEPGQNGLAARQGVLTAIATDVRLTF